MIVTVPAKHEFCWQSCIQGFPFFGRVCVCAVSFVIRSRSIIGKIGIMNGKQGHIFHRLV